MPGPLKAILFMFAILFALMGLMIVVGMIGFIGSKVAPFPPDPPTTAVERIHASCAKQFAEPDAIDACQTTIMVKIASDAQAERMRQAYKDAQ